MHKTSYLGTSFEGGLWGSNIDTFLIEETATHSQSIRTSDGYYKTERYVKDTVNVFR